MTIPESTTCVIAGGGPAGVMLGVLLSRAGIAVIVLEKHADFLRDFRGDTVHVSTQRVLDDMGLAEQFAQLPRQDLDSLSGTGNLRWFGRGRNEAGRTERRTAIVPQWEFLDLLATAGAAKPTFRLVHNVEVVGPLRHDGRVVGVRYRGPDGVVGQLRADLTVACDGRSSTLRSAMGLVPRSFDVPMDIWWFRLPRRLDDPAELSGVAHIDRRCVTTNRGDYYQIGLQISKGQDAALRARGIEALQRDITSLIPCMADRVGELTSFEEVKLLDVQMNRLRRWYGKGILFIGDAAHAMSPAGGIGINLAIADAVAAARILAPPLRTGRLSTRHLARIQLRRTLPTVIVQTVQGMLHARIVANRNSDPRSDHRPSRLTEILGRNPLVQAVFGLIIAVGPFSERAPEFARR
ncbi:FAD-dependent oxidoreductase [Mycolicibacter icosiumassiliensis]|uniref:FAD-dependent oxidoreductase n=1 Tax=Mycolicibacter icosiumassiliensis TaxID=1792835 RepID=UPI000832CFD0|nr:FAD-dependent oxidoreductase [Mycolicibacter icosiumassiliensis]